MKSKMLHFRKSLLAAVLIALLSTIGFYSCRNEDLVQTSENVSNKTLNQANRLISYIHFLQEIKKWDKPEIVDRLHLDQATMRTISDTTGVIRITPTRDSVRRISLNGHTTYTIALNPIVPGMKVFQNIVIDSSEAGIKTLGLTYDPDDKWIAAYRRNRRTDFYGNVRMTELSPFTPDDRNGKTMQQPVCTSVMVLSQVVEHLCCHNQQAHNGCNCPSNSKYYIEYLYNQVTTCIDVDIPPFGGMPGGPTGGGGGGTVPYPGGGYDPCSGDGQTRTNVTPCTPGNPNNPQPTTLPNTLVSELMLFAETKGVYFDYTVIPYLNSMPASIIANITQLINKFGAAVLGNLNDLYKVITGVKMATQEDNILTALGGPIAGQMFAVRLAYAANAYAAQTWTAAKYGQCAAVCSVCKGNAFKHALFLIINATSLGYEAAVLLAEAHESDQSGAPSLMDKKNNAAGAKIFNQYLGVGTPDQWITRVKESTDQGFNGMVCINNNITISTKQAQTACKE